MVVGDRHLFCRVLLGVGAYHASTNVEMGLLAVRVSIGLGLGEGTVTMMVSVEQNLLVTMVTVAAVVTMVPLEVPHTVRAGSGAGVS